ncbi:Adaptor protein complex sigma subunit [Exidia glandulosa HHB12029]|uniref:Adaptor protein complex sigma subunit n=1 Tax=Exidia glandulosa HHB12029 TaxID=1314781 RepID=A0A165PFL1_EXIGL|nr:Adaptor protein complex sigma subunit [Exidia glandulosa HHB12029]
MIHAVLIFNTSGTPRLSKFYTPQTTNPTALMNKIYTLISSRPAGLCNFLDAPELNALLGSKGGDDDVRVVYRSYATLCFVFVVDGSESELGILDLIQVFVESLDRAFEDVCELDLVFHFDEVHHILAEIIQGGLVLETNVVDIASAVQDNQKARKTSFSAANPLALGVGSGVGGRSANSAVPSPIGWLTTKFAGVGAR